MGDQRGYSSGKEADFKLKVSVDVPEIKQGAAGVIGDGSVAFATVSMAHAGELPENAELSVPIPDAENMGCRMFIFMTMTGAGSRTASVLQ